MLCWQFKMVKTPNIQTKADLRSSYVMRRRRMSTVPVLQLCMDDVIVIRGRRFHVSHLACCWHRMTNLRLSSNLHLAWRMSRLLLGQPHASRRAWPRTDMCCLRMASLQGLQVLEALLQQAEQDSVPVFLLFLADGAVVGLRLSLCQVPCFPAISPASQLPDQVRSTTGCCMHNAEHQCTAGHHKYNATS